MNEEQLKPVASQLRQPQGEEGIQVGEKMNEGNAFLNLAAIKQLKLQPNVSVLEIGMGNGFLVKDILSGNPSAKYIGCDFSELMVEQARKLNKTFINNGKAQFVLAEADNLPFAPESFDKVFTVNTLYFWNDPAAILTQIR